MRRDVAYSLRVLSVKGIDLDKQVRVIVGSNWPSASWSPSRPLVGRAQQRERPLFVLLIGYKLIGRASVRAQQSPSSKANIPNPHSFFV